MNRELYDYIKAYVPINEQERQDQAMMLHGIETYDDILFRTNKVAHVCVSSWIMNRAMDKVLFIHHNIYHSWGWCGGHCDGNGDLIAVALKEGKEETGLKNLMVDPQGILALDVLPVPAHRKHGALVEAHLHYNITFLCFADESEPIRIKPDENSAIGWFFVHEINELVRESHMIPIYQKLIHSSRKRLG